MRYPSHVSSPDSIFLQRREREYSIRSSLNPQKQDSLPLMDNCQDGGDVVDAVTCQGPSPPGFQSLAPALALITITIRSLTALGASERPPLSRRPCQASLGSKHVVWRASRIPGSTDALAFHVLPGGRRVYLVGLRKVCLAQATSRLPSGASSHSRRHQGWSETKYSLV